MQIDLGLMIDGFTTPRSVFEITPEDRETTVTLTVADLKELMLGVNAAHIRVQEVVKDLERIDRLERKLEVAERRIGVLETIVALSDE
jgi:hypothetical protein